MLVLSASQTTKKVVIIDYQVVSNDMFLSIRGFLVDMAARKEIEELLLEMDARVGRARRASRRLRRRVLLSAACVMTAATMGAWWYKHQPETPVRADTVQVQPAPPAQAPPPPSPEEIKQERERKLQQRVDEAIATIRTYAEQGKIDEAKAIYVDQRRRLHALQARPELEKIISHAYSKAVYAKVREDLGNVEVIASGEGVLRHFSIQERGLRQEREITDLDRADRLAVCGDRIYIGTIGESRGLPFLRKKELVLRRVPFEGGRIEEMSRFKVDADAEIGQIACPRVGRHGDIVGWIIEEGIRVLGDREGVVQDPRHYAPTSPIHRGYTLSTEGTGLRMVNEKLEFDMLFARGVQAATWVRRLDEGERDELATSALNAKERIRQAYADDDAVRAIRIVNRWLDIPFTMPDQAGIIREVYGVYHHERSLFEKARADEQREAAPTQEAGEALIARGERGAKERSPGAKESASVPSLEQMLQSDLTSIEEAMAEGSYAFAHQLYLNIRGKVKRSGDRDLRDLLERRYEQMVEEKVQEGLATINLVYVQDRAFENGDGEEHEERWINIFDPASKEHKALHILPEDVESLAVCGPFVYLLRKENDYGFLRRTSVLSLDRLPLNDDIMEGLGTSMYGVGSTTIDRFPDVEGLLCSTNKLFAGIEMDDGLYRLDGTLLREVDQHAYVRPGLSYNGYVVEVDGGFEITHEATGRSFFFEVEDLEEDMVGLVGRLPSRGIAQLRKGWLQANKDVVAKIKKDDVEGARALVNSYMRDGGSTLEETTAKLHLMQVFNGAYASKVQK